MLNKVFKNKPAYSLEELILGFMRSPRTFIHGLMGNDASHITFAEIERYLNRELKAIIEAGAYDGRDTAKLAKFWKSAAVHAFEPIPDLYKKVVDSTSALTNVAVYQLALVGSDETEIVINTFDSDSESHGSSSILEPTLHVQVAPKVVFNKKISVRATSLDKWAEDNHVLAADLIWLDLQGAELEVLQSSTNLLKTAQAIHIEVSRKPLYEGAPTIAEIDAFLSGFGFKRKITRIPVISGNALYVAQNS